MRGECCRLGIKASSIGPLVRCRKSASQFRRWNLAEAKAEWRAVGSMVHLTAVYTMEYIALYGTIWHYTGLHWTILDYSLSLIGFVVCKCCRASSPSWDRCSSIRSDVMQYIVEYNHKLLLLTPYKPLFMGVRGIRFPPEPVLRPSI
jgi:hypothetical protein